MNIERFHNELAMRLGYERIVKDKRILISVEESDDPMVTLKVKGHDNISFNASCNDCARYSIVPEIQSEVNVIFDAVYQAYNAAKKNLY